MSNKTVLKTYQDGGHIVFKCAAQNMEMRFSLGIRQAKKLAHKLLAQAELACSLSKVYNLSRGRCFYCERKMVIAAEAIEKDPFLAVTRDHLIPLSKGGSDALDNIVAACRRCNELKADDIYINYQI